jgi:hypothetical protein
MGQCDGDYLYFDLHPVLVKMVDMNDARLFSVQKFDLDLKI